MSHEKGLCWMTEDEIYINIPKNASTTYKKIMQDKGAVEANYHFLVKHQKENKKVWTIIREPIDRFISAMCQLERLGDLPDIFNNEHLKPQSWFLQGIKIDEYIKFDSLNGQGLNKSTHKERRRISPPYSLLDEIYANDIKLYHSL